MVAYLACLLVVTQYFGWTTDPRAAGLGEAHAYVVLQVLKLVTNLNYTGTDFLKTKLVEWYQAALKSDRHAPSKEDRGEEVDGNGEGGRGVREGVQAQCSRCLIWTHEPLQPDFDAKEDRQTDVGDKQTEGLHLIQAV